MLVTEKTMVIIGHLFAKEQSLFFH